VLKGNVKKVSFVVDSRSRIQATQSQALQRRVEALMPCFPSIAVPGCEVSAWLLNQSGAAYSQMKGAVEQFQERFVIDNGHRNFGEIEFGTQQSGNFFRGRDNSGCHLTLKSGFYRTLFVEIYFGRRLGDALLSRVLESLPDNLTLAIDTLDKQSINMTVFDLLSALSA